MDLFNKILNSNYLLSSFLFGTSICLYYYQINYQYVKKIIKDKFEETYKITNTNDSIDYELVLELKKREELEFEQNKIEKNKYTNDNFFETEFNYVYYYNQ